MVICWWNNGYFQVIAKHIAEELPFLATENIIMSMVKKGGNRQVGSASYVFM